MAVPAEARQARSCPGGDTKIDVTLTTDRGGVQVSNRKTLSDLRRMVTGSRHGGPLGRVLGLTRMSLDFRMQANTKVFTRDRRNYCVSLSKVKAHLGFKDFEVYVARRYKPGTCAYRVTKAHEMTHVSLYRRELGDAVGPFKTALAEAAARIPVIWSRDPQAATGKMLRDLDRAIQPVLKRMNREMEISNGRIDTKEAYAREHRKCRDW